MIRETQRAVSRVVEFPFQLASGFCECLCVWYRCADSADDHEQLFLLVNRSHDTDKKAEIPWLLPPVCI